jgi:hypothetical protein
MKHANGYPCNQFIKGRRPLGIPRSRWEDNIEMDL